MRHLKMRKARQDDVRVAGGLVEVVVDTDHAFACGECVIEFACVRRTDRVETIVNGPGRPGPFSIADQGLAACFVAVIFGYKE